MGKWEGMKGAYREPDERFEDPTGVDGLRGTENEHNPPDMRAGWGGAGRRADRSAAG